MKLKAYYNEFKPEAAAMLRELIKQNLIADGDVDERSISDVTANDIKGYTQCHFFAGIGGWSCALRLAGWPDNKPIWTGSCPCQPFSVAGRRKGKSDDRHLWPAWFRLIREIKPATIFGEQVSSAITHGWWDDVANDLETKGYACGAAVLPACSVGNPHKRDRLWFVADSKYNGQHAPALSRGDDTSIFDNTQRSDVPLELERASNPIDVADTYVPRSQGCGQYEHQHEAQGRQTSDGLIGSVDVQWIDCPDGKSRPVEPSICLLANGISHRVPILHAFGNAIVPQVAQKFIEAYLAVCCVE